jgi:hypothetical protein
MTQTIHLPASEESRIRMGEPRKTYDVGSTSTAEKMKVPISKVQLGLVPLPNVKAATEKVDARSNIRHKPDRDLVKIPT